MARETLANPVEQEIREAKRTTTFVPKRTFVSKSEEKRVTILMRAKGLCSARTDNGPCTPFATGGLTCEWCDRELPQICAGCGEPGAGSDFNGKVYHMTCKMEAKREAGIK